MSAPKVAILVLVLVAVLFAVGLGAGLLRPSGPPSDPAADPLAKWLGALTGPPPAVAAREWRETVPVGGAFTLPAGGKMEAEVVPADARTREFVLTIDAADKAEVKATWTPTPDPARPKWMPDDALPVVVTLKPKGPREVKFQAPAKGGRLTLELAGGTAPQRVRVSGGG